MQSKIQFKGQLIGEEVPSELIKGVGRKYNMLDNMTRKFTVKGYSAKTKLNMWDLLSIYDREKKQEDDKASAVKMKRQKDYLREFYNQ